jgi:hypothetical protein
VTTGGGVTRGGAQTEGGAVTTGGGVTCGGAQTEGRGGTSGGGVSTGGAQTEGGAETAGGAVSEGGAVTTGGGVTRGGAETAGRGGTGDGTRSVADVEDQVRAPEAVPGSDVALLVSGMMVAPALAAARVLRSAGIATLVLNIPVIKPLDTASRARSRRRGRPAAQRLINAAWPALDRTGTPRRSSVLRSGQPLPSTATFFRRDLCKS